MQIPSPDIIIPPVVRLPVAETTPHDGQVACHTAYVTILKKLNLMSLAAFHNIQLGVFAYN